jgi:hypothetical protein
MLEPVITSRGLPLEVKIDLMTSSNQTSDSEMLAVSHFIQRKALAYLEDLEPSSQ